MNTSQIIRLFQSLDQLQKEQILNTLVGIFDQEDCNFDGAIRALDQNWLKPPSCPHCGSDKSYRRGYYKGVPRYSCKVCLKYWMATYGTTIERLKKKHLWSKYIQAFLQKSSLRTAAMQVGISLGTSFNWRHLLLTRLNQLLPENIRGTLECVNMSLSYLEKGKNNTPKFVDENQQLRPIPKPNSVQLLIAKSRDAGMVYSGIIAIEKPDRNQYCLQFEKITQHANWVISSKSMKKMLIQVSHRLSFVENYCQNHSRVHLDNVKKFQNLTIEFLKPFRGVSTKYLYHYLNWQNFLLTESRPAHTARYILKNCLLPSDSTKKLKEIKLFGINIITDKKYSTHSPPIL